VANCTSATCSLNIGFISSPDGGANWTAFTAVAGPMTLSWLPNTSQGRMVGDYISTSYGSDGLTHAAFAVANAPTLGGSDCATATPNCDQATYSTASGLAAPSGPLTAAEVGVELNSIPMNAAEHAADQSALTSR
jgi:hypothetical protein